MEDRLTAGEWNARARALGDEGWWLVDLCGVDRLGIGGDRFEVVVQLLHLSDKRRTTLYVVPEGEPPALPSVVEVWPAADFMEREAYDMFGIAFEGHPNLTRIFMPDEWEGHPLRKDYGVGKVPVEFIPQPLLQIEAPGQSPNTEDADHDVDDLGQAGVPDRVWGVAEDGTIRPRSGSA